MHGGGLCGGLGGVRWGIGGAVAERGEVMVTDQVLSLDPADPASVGGYRLRGRLGEGGMGVVYLAGKPGDQVAIKTMRKADVADPEARGRFIAEARLAANLDCDYTAQVIDDGSEENFPYLVTEYVPGPSLAEAVRSEGRLPAKTVLALAIG